MTFRCGGAIRFNIVISATHWQSELCKHASVSAAGLGGTESPIGRRNDGLRGLGNTRGERNAEAWR